MKSYHSIQKYSQEDLGKYIYAFDKADGSNFRAEWDRKLSKKSRFTNGFGKFGTRTEMIKHIALPFYEGVKIFNRKYSEKLDEIFNTHKAFRGIERITVYGEFFGENSFAGMHDWDEEHDVRIFDTFLYKKDFLSPSEFIEIFQHLDIPKVVYQGYFTEEILKSIEDNEFDLEEGVVCKGVENQKIYMFKIKTQDWLNRVRAKYGINNNIE